MSLIETESLVLKSYSLAEADKIVIFLTQNHGLIKGVAKGAKRLKSRFGGGLEPFSIVNLTFLQKEERELVSIRNLELKKSYFENASDTEFLKKFSYLVELLIEFAPPNEPNQRLYRMACVCLETASQENSSLEALVIYFELWILKLAGYLPDWKNCSNCRNPLLENDQALLQINFQLLCKMCQKSGNKSNLLPVERNIFLLAQSTSPIKFIELTRGKMGEIKEVSQILRRIIAQILGKETVGERILTAIP